MCAAVRQRMDATGPSYQDDRYTSNIDPSRYRLTELGFG
jgi:hypothetical protein